MQAPGDGLKPKAQIGAAHLPAQEAAAGVGDGRGRVGGDLKLKVERFPGADEMAEARAEKFADAPAGKSRFQIAAEGFDDAGPRHARRAGKMALEKGSRREAATLDGVEYYLCHRRLKGRAGASCSRDMDTLCAPAAQGATW